MVSRCASARCTAWRSRAEVERSRYDIYYYIMAAPADEETDRWLRRASERTRAIGLRFKDQRVLGETPSGPYFAFEGQVKYSHLGRTGKGIGV